MRIFILLLLAFILDTQGLVEGKTEQSVDDRFISFIVDPKIQQLDFFWRDEKLEPFRSILSLKTWLGLQHRKLEFAMNAGMFNSDNTPHGLYIENKKTLKLLDTASGNGNFYLKPNGIFFISTDNEAGICSSIDFIDNGHIKYATQSGPMLVIDGQIHPAFKPGSANRNIRNGVGIMADHRIVFAMSKKEINFYEFASYFRSLGCQNALYLDGFVSRTYLPAQNWNQTDGNFAVILAVTTGAQ